MIIILSILHCIATLVLLYVVTTACRLAKIKLTIHNAPYVLLSLLFLGLIINASFLNPILYFIVASFIMVSHYLLDSINNEKLKKLSLQGRILLSFSIGIFWAQFIIYSLFYLSHANKINEKLKH